MLYFVPYEYIKKEVDVKITDTSIEIFYNHNRIASHRCLEGCRGQYSTITEHMPEDHQKYLEWNGNRFRRWADSIGINTMKAANAILTSGRVEQQTYRSYMGLLKLAEKHSAPKLEETCKRALLYSRTLIYKSIKNLLAAMKGNIEPVQNLDQLSSETQLQAHDSYRINITSIDAEYDISMC